MRRLMIFSLLILALGAGGAAAQEILNENYWLSAPVAISHTRLDSAAAYVYPGLSYPTGTVGVLLVGSVSGTGTTGGLNRPIFRLKVGGASTWELVYDIGSGPINHYWASGAASTALANEGYTGVAGFSAGSDVLTFSSVSWGHGVTYTADLNLYYLIDASVNPPPFDASFEATPASGPAPLTVSFTDTSTGDIVGWGWDFGDGTTSSLYQHPIHVYWENGTYPVTLTVHNVDGQTDTFSMDIVVADPAPSGTLLRPLERADEVLLFDSARLALYAEAVGPTLRYEYAPVIIGDDTVGSVNTLHAISASPGAFVHAVASGTVTSVEPLRWDDCAQISYVEYNEGLVINTTPPSPENPFCKGAFPRDGVDPQFNAQLYDFFYIDGVKAFLVEVRYGEDDAIITYVVKDAPEFVQAGDAITAGCVLGRTMALNALPTIDNSFARGLVTLTAVGAAAITTALSGGVAAVFWSVLGGIFGNIALNDITYPETDYGVAALMYYVDLEQRPLLPQIGGTYPTSEDRCGLDAAYSECETVNADLNMAGYGWFTDGNFVEWQNPGVILHPGESIYQELNLPTDVDLALSVLAAPVNGDTAEAAITLQLGETIQRETALLSELTRYEIAAALHTPDLGSSYTVRVSNTGRKDVELRYVCATRGAPNVAPSGCYFANSSFDYGLQSWTVVEGEVTELTGALRLRANAVPRGSISQDVRLLPEEEGVEYTYTLTVESRAFLALPSATGTYTLKVTYDGVTYDIGDPINAVGAGYLVMYEKRSVSIPVTTETVGPMVISFVHGDDPAGSLLSIEILDVCLEGPFPGQGGAGWEPASGCRKNAPPMSSDVGQWTAWHWANLDNAFQCELFPLLRKTYKRIDDGFTLVGWQARYWSDSASMTGKWLGTRLFPYLNGHFRNIALGQVTTIEGGGGAGLWDVLLAFINLIRPVIDLITSTLGTTVTLLLSVITGVIGFIVSLASQGLSIIQQATGLLSTLISAYNNAPPQSLPGMPSCSVDPKGHPLCIAWWVLDNTIFSGPGALVIPVITGVLSIHLVLWVVGELKRALVETGTGS